MKLLKTITLISLLSLSLMANQLKKVDVQLQWKHQFEFAGFYVAKEKGYYKSFGLDVGLKEWNHGIDIVDDVIQNKSQYAVARPVSLIDIANNKKLIYLAAFYQSSPLVLLANKDSGIETIQDIKNKRVMINQDHINDSSITSMLFSQGLKIEDIKIIQHSFDVKDLKNGKTDLMVSYISNEPYSFKELGGQSVIFSPKDYGFDFYNDILVTSKNYLEANPDEVKKFRNATIMGFEYAFANIDEVVDLIYNKYNSQNKSKSALRFEALELKKLAYYKVQKFGDIQLNKLERVLDIYKLLGLVKQEINLNQVIYNELTLDVDLSEGEKEYLEQRGAIKICIDPNWMPFESFDENGNYIGMSADYFKIFENNINAKFEIVKTDSWQESIEFAKERKCDIFSLAMQTKNRSEYMNFTTPYLKIPLVITTKLGVPFVNEVEELSGKKVGITKGYAFVEILRNRYPSINLIEVENIDEGLDRVSKDTLHAYIGTLASVGYKFQNKYSGELKIAGKVSDNWELGIGVRNDDAQLLKILQKAINSVTYDQRREILNKWVSIKYEKGIDYTALYKAIGVFFLVLLIVVYFYNKQRILHKKLELAYEELEKLAVTDKLTNLYNRHKLDSILTSEKSRSDRYLTTFGIILLDIDYFKSINDKYGHHEGDEVLKEISDILKANSREIDIVGRWGGEEFLIVVPESSKSSALKLAENLREKVQKHIFKNVGSVTVSAGVCIYKLNESIQEAVKRADNALYLSKRNGRNQVSFND